MLSLLIECGILGLTLVAMKMIRLLILSILLPL
ncbi:uncharacterized protein METZ01_LOCUS303733, partial [marine metagenome]